MRMRRFLALQAIAFILAGVAHAQKLSELQVGDRVRVSITPNRVWSVGRYDGRAMDTLWIGQCDGCLGGRVPIARINELDVSDGLPRSRTRQVVYSTLIGLTVGAIGGGIAGHAQHTKSNCQDGLFCGSEGTVSATVYGVIGAAVGAGISAVLPKPREHWRQILLN
jgi:hypothetical protein